VPQFLIIKKNPFKMAKIIIPSPLRKFTDNLSTVETSANTVEAAINELTIKHSSLKKHILDTEGKIRSFIRIYVGEDDINTLNQGQTSIAQDTVISIVPAIAGG
jgi:molybdopterin synthase sulfur carrier subunit